MKSVRKVNAVKLWNDIIVDINSVSGFTAPFIRRDANYHRSPSDISFYMEFVIHTHPSKITVSEKLASGTPVTLDENLYKYVKATKENSCDDNGLPLFKKISYGWLLSDGYYTIAPNESVVIFQEFLSKFTELVNVWNNGKDVQCLTSVEGDKPNELAP